MLSVFILVAVAHLPLCLFAGSSLQAPSAPRRLLLSSLHPISRSGYGQQAQLLIGELRSRGWEVCLLSWNIAQRGDEAADLEALLSRHGVPRKELLRQAGWDSRVLLSGVRLITAKLSPPQGFEEGQGWLDILRAVDICKPDIILHLHDAWWLGSPPLEAITRAASGLLPPLVAWLPIVFDPLLSDDPTRPDRSGAALRLFTGVVAMSHWGRGVYEGALALLMDANSSLAAVDGHDDSSDEPRQPIVDWLPPLLGRVPHALHPAFEEGPIETALTANIRIALGLPPLGAGFVVLIVGRNTPLPSSEARRKSHAAAIKAFARFKRWVMERCMPHTSVVTAASMTPLMREGCPAVYREPHLHLHCDLNGGVDLRKALEEVGLSATGPGVSNSKERFAPEQLRALYSASDVLLQLSRAEGFGLPVVEAQACGVQVIANGATAMAEHVVLGEVLPLTGKASGGRRDRLGSWTPPDVQKAAEALYAAWLSPPTFVERNLARMTLSAELAPSRVAAAMESHLLSLLPQRLDRTGNGTKKNNKETLPYKTERQYLTDGVVPQADMLHGAAASKQGGVARLSVIDEAPDPRPICPAQYRNFAEACLQPSASTAKASQTSSCVDLQDLFRACLRRDWTQLGGGPKPRLPYPKNTDAIHRQVTTRFGAPMLYSVFDLYVGRSLEVYGEWLGRELRLYEALLEENAGARVIEIGANIGAMTVPMALRVGMKGQVVAIEMGRVNSQLLAANVALAQLLNVELVRAAVGAMPGRADLPHERPSSRLVFSNFRAMQTIERASTSGETVIETSLDLPPVGVAAVQRTTVDHLSIAISRLDLLKVALPGLQASIDVLRGASQALHRLRPWLHIELPQSRGYDSVQQFLKGLGYSCTRCDMLLFREDNWKGEVENIFVPLSAASYAILCGHEAGPAGLHAVATDVEAGRKGRAKSAETPTRFASASQVCEEETLAVATASATLGGTSTPDL